MGVLDFIFGLVVLAVLFVCFIGFIGMKYDTKKLEEKNAQLSIENIKLRADIKKARKGKKNVK